VNASERLCLELGKQSCAMVSTAHAVLLSFGVSHSPTQSICCAADADVWIAMQCGKPKKHHCWLREGMAEAVSKKTGLGNFWEIVR